jgi:hypothetical protein
MWYNLAAAGFTPEEYPWGEREERDIVADKLTPAALNEAQRRATEWDAAHPREP